MLPLRLELHNFLAYRAPDPIILEDLHLACLSGANGSGKSSLLDAITWALWGKARADSDELVHMGQSEMQVVLEFLQGQQLYRVIRRRKIGGAKAGGGRSAGQSELNFFAWNPARQHFTLISEPSIRDTQAKINKLLHLDYDIFVNSAFLQQGRADSFTLKTAAERKKILSDILGLDRWSSYEDEVKLKLGELGQQISLYTARIAEMEDEIRKEPQIEQELSLAREQMHLALGEVERAEARLDEVKGADLELKRVQESLAAVDYSIRERKKDLTDTAKEITRYEQTLAEFQTVLDNRQQIEQGYAQLESARQADLALGDKLRDLNQLNQRVAQLDKQLVEARQAIELEVRQLETELAADENIVQVGNALQDTLTNLQAEITLLETLEIQRETQQAQLTTLGEHKASLEATNKSIEQEANTLKERLALLEGSTEAHCPICQQPLNEQQKNDLLAQMNADLEGFRLTYKQHRTEITELEQDLKNLKDAIQGAGKQLKDLPRLRGQQGGYEQQIKEAHAAQLRIQTKQVTLNEFFHVLQEERYGEEIRQQLTEAHTQRETLGYDPNQHDAVREQLETHLDYQRQAQALEVALQALPDTQEGLERAQNRYSRYENSLSDYEAQAATLQADIEGLHVKVETMLIRETELNQQRSLLRSADEKVISHEQQLRAIEMNRKRREEMLERRDELAVEENLYEQLKLAFGKNGIPAMLIEAAIPEVEEAANRLLSRMTNNRMHLRFDTQREKKTGGISETLDILIADELGTRDYSLFSGGEAFRVNFAIRVALSQLLARRAGAQLRTLFVDEGFGTQDDIGRERLIEAISAIQDDFDLILVITHIEELRDLFPARIEIMKTQNGSVAVVR